MIKRSVLIELPNVWGKDTASLQEGTPVEFSIIQNDYSIVKFSLNQPESMRRVAELLTLAAYEQEQLLNG